MFTAPRLLPTTLAAPVIQADLRSEGRQSRGDTRDIVTAKVGKVSTVSQSLPVVRDGADAVISPAASAPHRIHAFRARFIPVASFGSGDFAKPYAAQDVAVRLIEPLAVVPFHSADVATAA